MRRTSILLLLAGVLLGPAPARATDPTLLVATQSDGALVKVTVVGRVAVVEPLVPATTGAFHVASHAVGTSVAYSTWVKRRADVSVVNVATGARQRHSRDGRTGQLLVSRDGRVRCVLRNDAAGSYAVLARLEPGGRRRTLYAPDPREYADYFLSGAAITPNGRTVYVARTTRSQPSPIWAVDTATGRRREVPTDRSMMWVLNVVLSPDARMLAVSYVDLSYRLHVGVLPVTGGKPRLLALPVDRPLYATAFTPDSTAVLLTTTSIRVRGPVATPGLMLGDVESGRVTPILGTQDLQLAVAVA